uniref:Methyltransferase n=1 Tax=Lactuca sativa TaxID=4236 RepID=A0A9R1VGU5_LACSA|nr:hypothetical protein LSAT_V11C500288390 [Lactuca sativa]
MEDLNVWVMNVVPLNSPDTLPIIYERGLFGIYHTGVNHSVLTHVHMIFFMLIIFFQILKKGIHQSSVSLQCTFVELFFCSILYFVS